MSLKITCMDGRKFVTDKAFRTHVQKVHAKTPVLFAKFELITGDKSEITVGVPYRAGIDTKTQDDVEHEKGECEDCKANASASRLPVHPGCGCTPVGGWDAYIGGLKQPDDTSEELWGDFLKFLGKAKKGQI